MCYYNGQKVTRAEYIRLKQLERAVKNFNFLDKGVISGFTNTPVAVIVPTPDRSNFEIVEMEWGFIPNYLKNREEVQRMRGGYKDGKGKWVQGQPQLNAKSENLFVSERSGRKSMFYDAAQNRRCLVLSTGYFEWQHVYRKNKRSGEAVKKPDTYPYYITLRDHEYFFMAGIWNPWTDQDTGEMSNTVALVTAEANLLAKVVHNSKERMPTILNDDLAWRWIMEDLTNDEILATAATQFPYQEMSACTITKDFLGRLDPTEPFKYDELPAIELAIEALLNDGQTPTSTSGEQPTLF